MVILAYCILFYGAAVRYRSMAFYSFHLHSSQPNDRVIPTSICFGVFYVDIYAQLCLRVDLWYSNVNIAVGNERFTCRTYQKGEQDLMPSSVRKLVDNSVFSRLTTNFNRIIPRNVSTVCRLNLDG